MQVTGVHAHIRCRVNIQPSSENLVRENLVVLEISVQIVNKSTGTPVCNLPNFF